MNRRRKFVTKSSFKVRGGWSWNDFPKVRFNPRTGQVVTIKRKPKPLVDPNSVNPVDYKFNQKNRNENTGGHFGGGRFPEKKKKLPIPFPLVYKAAKEYASAKKKLKFENNAMKMGYRPFRRVGRPKGSKNKPKSKLSTPYIQPSGLGATFSKFALHLRKRRGRAYKIGRAITGKMRYFISKPQKISSIAGQQANYSFTPFDKFTRNQLFNYFYQGQSIYSAPPLNTLSTGTYANTVCFDKAYQRYMITNTEISTCILKLYWMIPRSDQNNSPELDFINLTTFQSAVTTLGSTDEVLYQGISSINVQGTTSSYYTSADTPGVTPFHSSTWCKFWKVLKIFTIELAQGQTHVHTFRQNINRAFTGAQMGKLNNNYVRSIFPTHTLMMSAYGTPVHDSTVTTTVTTSKVALDVVVFSDYLGHVVQNNESFTYDYQGLTAVTTEATLSPGAGIIETD